MFYTKKEKMKFRGLVKYIQKLEKRVEHLENQTYPKNNIKEIKTAEEFIDHILKFDC
jgi:hypothetical protein